MFEDEDVMKTCIQHRISVEQYFFMYLLSRRDFNKPEEESLARQYINRVKRFKLDDIKDLEDRGFIEDMNSPGQSFPEFYILPPKIYEKFFFHEEDDGEELWLAYPAKFPLRDKGTEFLARTGGDKHELLSIYRKRIKNSKKKHKFVMEQLEKYKRLVKSGKINGRRIAEFIKFELWDSIAECTETDFYEDI